LLIKNGQVGRSAVLYSQVPLHLALNPEIIRSGTRLLEGFQGRKMMIIKQIAIGYMDNFSYIIGCENTRRALVIDPGPDVERIVSEAQKENLEIVTIVNTHGHGDHTAGNAPLKARTGAEIIIHELDGDRYPDADVLLSNEKTLQLGDITFDVIHTPGHTPGGICLHAMGNLFTGDTLFVGDSGRTDLTGGDRLTMGQSICRLMILPDTTVVWPGHDYGPTPSSTISWEKRNNVNAIEYGYFVQD
jgi:glyoxylase-like metal-dependent hydrolase (beta-lactamase superfamily II)